MAVDSQKDLESGKGTPSHYRESVKLLRELHFLMAAGKSETDEADRVRDLMDDHWYQLSPQEIRRIEGLSADLYTLVDPPLPPQQLDQREIDEFNQPSATAAKNNDWDRVLELF